MKPKVIYVNSELGDDRNDGRTIDRPKRTLEAAVATARARKRRRRR